jgi:probable HAF family extracellular repeat protein
MSRIIAFPYFASLGIFLSLVSPATADGPFFMGLGQIEGYDGWGSFAQAISGDGHVVVGSSQEGSDLAMAFRWTLEEGMVPLGFLPGGDSSFAKGVSGDGSVIVGLSKSYNTVEDGEWEAFKWTAETGMVGLGDLPGSYFRSRAYDVTADGETVVGHGTRSEVVAVRHAVRWAGNGPPEDLGGMPGVIPELAKSNATAVSHEGSVIAGWAWNQDFEQEAVIWTEDEGIVGLGDLDEEAVRSSIAWDVAVNTEIRVVGRSYISGSDYEAFLWTQNSGMVGLGDLPGGNHSSTAYGISGDGNVIVGHSSGDPGGAFIWDEQHGIQHLKELLEAQFGFDLSEWSSLSVAYGVSDDGLTIVGSGTRAGVTEAWMAHVPEPASFSLVLIGVWFAFGGRQGGSRPPVHE